VTTGEPLTSEFAEDSRRSRRKTKAMNDAPQFRLAGESDADTLLVFMREYYAFDGHGFDEDKARIALTATAIELRYAQSSLSMTAEF